MFHVASAGMLVLSGLAYLTGEDTTGCVMIAVWGVLLQLWHMERK
jgi:hypothetical protein